MTTSESKGQTLLTAVERLVAPDADILRVVAEERARGPGASERIVSRFSNRSALVGALAGAPSLVPGWGIIGALGTVVAEMTYVLRTEVEMCLALASHHGLDITRRDHRQWAFLLAAVGTHEVAVGRDPLRDAGAIGWEAAWKYSPREVSKMVITVFGFIAIAAASRAIGRGILRAVPIVGMVAGAGVNKVLTQRVGRRAIAALRLRPSESLAEGSS
jgi:hypothetical protein